MKQFVIGDLHFGVYANSIEWLESQLKYLNGVILTEIKKRESELDSVIFLGDLFDNRYALNVMVGCRIKKAITEFVDSIPNIHIYMIGGNHDYYSPQEEMKEYNSYDLVFGEEYLAKHTNLHIYTQEAHYVGGKLFLPWYCTDNPDIFNALIEKYKPTVAYCHTDLMALGEEIVDTARKNGTTIISGHIHFPSLKWLSTSSSLYSIGAALPLTFNDVNSTRFVYVFEDSVLSEKIANTYTIQFKRYFNEEIFNLTEESFKNSNTQLCISDKNINTARYIEQLSLLKESFGTSHKITIQPINEDIVYENTEDLQIVTNINKFIEDNIPSHLTEKYNYIKKKIKEEE